ncbi:MAG TPA: glycoside hydrolase family 97 protein, partial [Flavisolibacter sp.]|nr:glycoside hydrolase family 97 protein [Flavisolibacter sp.]
NGQPVIHSGAVALVVDSTELGRNPVVLSKNTKTIKENSLAVVARKSKNVEDHCNELTLLFKGNYGINFRVYDDGIAYRFQTSFKKEIIVNTEKLTVNFEPESKVLFPEEEHFMSHYETSYLDTSLASISKTRFCSLPVLVSSRQGINVLITDADLFDYPNMFMSGTNANSLTACFPNAVLETLPGRTADRSEKIIKEASYIAKTNGTRSFPWRTFIITSEDSKLVESDMVFKLSRPSSLKDFSWVKPGKVAWDWWNANNIYGVDFRAGLNTATYKYYIDFAAKYNLEYIILDEGWSATTTDLRTSIPNIDLQELINYGKAKNVGIILWVLWKPLEQNMQAVLDKFAQWGVKGIKVDFMQRADQGMVNYYERVAKECAARKLLVDFHGAFKPAGLNRAYPNVINQEGVKGAENNKWSNSITPEHNLTLPFTRMVAGSMDYTPGAMNNAGKKSFRDIFDRPMSMGTRCHQIAMYVVYESPLQMLADSPSNYYREEESTEFISKIPVTWDETHVLDAKVADYILIARKKDNTWYVGAMTDWTPREMAVDLSFLEKGNYTMEIMQDGINADRYGNDYKKTVLKVTKETKLKINLAPGGGWAAIIKKDSN